MNAACKALDWVRPHMRLGLGTGSTADCFVEALASWADRQTLTLVTSSHSTAILARKLGLVISPFDSVDSLDLYVDGADEIDPKLNLIKGRGAAMLQEKILAASAKEFLVIADESKLVPALGTKFSVPVETIPYAWRSVEKKLTAMGGIPTLRVGSGKDGPVITDFGNFVFDVRFSENTDYVLIDKTLCRIPGIVGHGLFMGMSKTAIIGTEKGVKLMITPTAL